MKQLSPLQLSVLRVLWDRGEASVAEVHERVQATRPLALNTVATLLSRLERAGIVAHRQEGRSYIYRAVVTEREARGSVVRQVLDGLFGGSSSALVSHLLDEQDLDADELARLQALLDARERVPDHNGQ
jgi:predicted transcriptional regulator